MFTRFILFCADSLFKKFGGWFLNCTLLMSFSSFFAVVDQDLMKFLLTLHSAKNSNLFVYHHCLDAKSAIVYLLKVWSLEFSVDIWSYFYFEKSKDWNKCFCLMIICLKIWSIVCWFLVYLKVQKIFVRFCLQLSQI